MLRVRARRVDREATADGIYGIIVSAAVMAASHARSAVAVALSVLVTLIVYWAAERYAGLLAERIHEGHRLDRRQVRRHLTRGWEIVTASWLPLLVLVLLRSVGTSLSAAIGWALGCSTALLCVAGWEMGRQSALSTGERLLSAATAGMFGVLMILLKALLH
ncbi:hypothetical protein Val02_47950 [Virgisporangium aliadipatigenens]|uniref:Uncharacterized protein n=1 Tax=Virgisporangium aliadipatigenens TaxID=741659 RepID=A0A8J3YLX2_9ACTN|nr:hypothetical protein [Virgisporangium aliadipatigenens]GIJ47909.1 hypothetical protein Val02_47950 [Virgisporangium aliadipatigenens]